MKLAIVASHPIQYYAPLFRELSKKIDLVVFFANNSTPQQQAAAGFGTAFNWDIDLLSGYDSCFLTNVSPNPNTSTFSGCDTPEVADRLSTGGFDAVLSMGWHLKCFWQAMWICKRHGIPILVRGDSQLGSARGFLWKILKEFSYPGILRLFDAILYVGTNNKAYLDHYRYPSERQFYSPHCVDVKWFQERAGAAARATMRNSLGLSEGQVNILFAGKLLDFKRPLDVLKAASFLQKDHPLCVTIAGSGELETSVMEFANQNSVPIRYLGFCNQSRMPAVYACADVLVLPSDGRETWGLVCNEAIACGTPIVVSDAVGCAPDFSKFKEIARHFPMGDANALAEAISATVNGPLDENGFTDANEQFSLRTASAGVVNAIKSVCRS